MKVLLLAVCAAATGCTAVAPTIQYREIHKAQDMTGMTDAFYLQANEIVVAKRPDTEVTSGSSKGSTVSEFDVTSNRRESIYKYGIKSVTSWRSETKVNLNKIQNTDLVNSIGVEVTDNTAKAITDYGGALVKLIGVVGGMFDLGPACPFPVRIPVDLKDEGTGPTDLGDGCVKVKVQALPPDAFRRELMPSDQDTSNFYYAACREAIVTVDVSGTDGVKYKRVRVADPRFVQTVQLPNKGAVTVHSECGVSVETQQVASDNGAAVIGALATQGKAIKDAIDASKKK